MAMERLVWPVAPMKATNGRMPSDPSGWVAEPKWDGHRAIARVVGDRIDIVSSTGKPRTQQWPWLVTAVRNAVDGDAILDGEVIAYGDDGRHSFQAVGRADRAHSFVVFDLLSLGDTVLVDVPWHERRELLESSVTGRGSVSITPVTDDLDAMVAVTKAQRYEGVIVKRTDSVYLPGRRTSSWVKVKYRYEQEMVVGGYKVGEGNRSGTFGSLLVGVYEPDGGLRFVGAVGTGFDDSTLDAVLARLRPLATDVCPFTTVPKLPGRPMLRWVRPELVAQVSFAEWTDGGGIRAPSFLGLRDDKDPRDVVRE
jgi:bifunctional non-homologous end joining protein LigD